jgi:hypothetical protein
VILQDRCEIDYRNKDDGAVIDGDMRTKSRSEISIDDPRGSRDPFPDIMQKEREHRLEGKHLFILTL